MKRSSFLKSLVALVAAPSFLAEINAKPVVRPIVKKANVFRLPCYFKVTEEMLADKEFIARKVKSIANGRNVTVQVGWDNDDFLTNCATILIKEQK